MLLKQRSANNSKRRLTACTGPQRSNRSAVMGVASSSSPEIQALGRHARPEGFIFHFRKNVFIFLDLKVLGALLF